MNDNEERQTLLASLLYARSCVQTLSKEQFVKNNLILILSLIYMYLF